MGTATQSILQSRGRWWQLPRLCTLLFCLLLFSFALCLHGLRASRVCRLDVWATLLVGRVSRVVSCVVRSTSSLERTRRRVVSVVCRRAGPRRVSCVSVCVYIICTIDVPCDVRLQNQHDVNL